MSYELLCGDALFWLDQLEDVSIDAVVCDPPYGTTQNKWDSIIPLQPFWA
jgi:tRNA G10  N-methylase Trm11